MIMQLIEDEIKLFDILLGLSLLLSALAAGCSSSHIVSSNPDDSFFSTQYSIPEFNTFVKNEKGIITLKIDSASLNGSNIELKSDSLFWTNDNEHSVGADIDQIKDVVFTKTSRGILDGLGFGFLSGAATGLLVAEMGNLFNDQSTAESRGWGFLLLPPFGGVIGAVIGSITGGFLGHTYKYTFEKGTGSEIRKKVMDTRSEPQTQTRDMIALPVKNSSYVEYAGLILWGTISVNFERAITDHFSIRTGIGKTLNISRTDWTYSTVSPLLMMNYMTTDGADHLEAGLGAALVYQSDVWSLPRNQWIVLPALSIGYRYQTAEAGFIFRAGLTWTYLYGFPIQFSIGHSF